MLRLRDIMTRDVVSASPDLPLDQLTELFARHHIGGAPVLAGDRLVGFISASDVLTFAVSIAGRPLLIDDDSYESGDELGLSDIESEELSAGYFTSLMGGDAGDGTEAEEDLSSEGRSILFEYTVADAMSTQVLSLPPETDVVAAADFLRNRGVHRVLVAKGDRLEGIVSTMDIVRAVAFRQIPEHNVSMHEADFDSGWSHEPLIPDTEPIAFNA